METQPVPNQQPKKKSNWWKWILGILGGLIVLGQLGKNKADDNLAALDTDTTSVIATETPAEVASAPAPLENWYYSVDEDKMGSKSKTAAVEATELLDFEFPYNGGSTATFVLRKKGGETDAYLRVSKGQFITNVSDGGTSRIRFDSGTPKTFSTSGAADYSSDIVFFNSPQSIIKKLKGAKKMIIEVQFYNEGNRQIEFNVADLKW